MPQVRSVTWRWLFEGPNPVKIPRAVKILKTDFHSRILLAADEIFVSEPARKTNRTLSVCILSLVLVSRRTRQCFLADHVKDDCSTSKLLCFSLIIGDFTTYDNQALKVKLTYLMVIYPNSC